MFSVPFCFLKPSPNEKTTAGSYNSAASAKISQLCFMHRGPDIKCYYFTYPGQYRRDTAGVFAAG